MKIPAPPPTLKEITEEMGADRILELLTLEIGPEPRGRYLHWDQLRHRPAPGDISHEEWWFMVKQARLMNSQKVLLKDLHGLPFAFTMTGGLLKKLHRMDRDASGSIRAEAPIANDVNRDRYIISSLIEESITSSQLEGASTTTREAKNMLRSGRPPRDRSEQMILNNFNAMSFIRDHREEPLSVEFLFELHTILTINTLDDPTGSGRWRRKEEDITIQDSRDGTVLYAPPDADLIPERIDKLLKFANKEDHDSFIHPVVCAVILHFMLSYEHPFIDGNGRTARALFYWYMAKAKYWLIEFISISKIIKQAPIQYAKSFIYVENDGNDLSYFLDHQFDVILKSIKSLFTYLSNKTVEFKKTESIMRGALQKILNHRQIAVISHALKNPGFDYTIRSHSRSHSVTYQTARTDLLDLAELGLLNQYQRGKAFMFESPANLGDLIKDIGSR